MKCKHQIGLGLAHHPLFHLLLAINLNLIIYLILMMYLIIRGCSQALP